METPDHSCIVIGGGIIGLSAAFALQRSGIPTLLIDPEPVRRAASWGNAGHIATEQVTPLASRAMLQSLPQRLSMFGGPVGLPLRDLRAWLPFGLRLVGASGSRRLAHGTAALGALLAEAIPAWRRSLAAAERPYLLREGGHFLLWESDRTAAAGRRAWSNANLGTASVRDVTSAEARDLMHLIGKAPADAIRFEGTGQVADPGEVAAALARAFAAAGGREHHAQVGSVETSSGGGIQIHLQTGERLMGETVIVAAGLGSKALLEPLGHRVPIIAERGYHIQSSQTDWPDGVPPVVFEDRSMIVTRFSSGLRAAGFVEFGRAQSPPDPRKWRRLRRHVADLGIRFGEPSTDWFGARPTLPDYLPAIGRSRHAPGLIYAFGHQHLGLTLAAVTGELVASLAARRKPAIPIAPFDVDRFDRRAR
jgi:D-hydroxyproline dehydrogenase